MTEVTKQIKSKASTDTNEVEDSANFVSLFQDFVWTLRDVILRLEEDGELLTADEYLENFLKLSLVKGTADWNTERKDTEN